MLRTWGGFQAAYCSPDACTGGLHAQAACCCTCVIWQLAVGRRCRLGQPLNDIATRCLPLPAAVTQVAQGGLDLGAVHQGARVHHEQRGNLPVRGGTGAGPRALKDRQCGWQRGDGCNHRSSSAGRQPLRLPCTPVRRGASLSAAHLVLPALTGYQPCAG